MLLPYKIYNELGLVSIFFTRNAVMDPSERGEVFMKNSGNSARMVALGGVMAALAVIIMSLGGLIPVATYVCPMLCTIILNIVVHSCGFRIGWAWFAAVSILGLLLGPDKEAAAVFLFIGYYPLVKPSMDKFPLKWIWKGLLFNGTILLMYWLLQNLFGMDQLSNDFESLGKIGLIVMLLMGNFIFFMLDRLLGMRFEGRSK